MNEDATVSEAPVSTPTNGKSGTNYMVIGVVILVLLVGGLGFAFKSKIKEMLVPASAGQETPVPEASSTGTETQAVVVERNDSGFSPKTVTIKKGTAVKFVNKTAMPMWVASAPHPTHTDLPGFDQLSSGDSYSYTFTKVGSWKYHNHAPFGPGGVVVVTE